MKYLFLLVFILVGCGKNNAYYNDSLVEYDEHFWGKQVDVYRNDKIIKKFEYVKKEKQEEKEFKTEYVKSDMYSCQYTGLCRYYDYKKSKYRFGFSSSCKGSRHEKRKYTVHTVYSTLKYIGFRNTLILKLHPYESTNYTLLEKEECK